MEAVPSNLPPRARARVEPAIAALIQELGVNLYSLIAYGSAVRGGFDAAGSDVNLLVVLDESTVDAHVVIEQIVRAAKIEIEPFVVPRREFAATAKAFAAKFLSIRRNHQVLHGADIMLSLDVEPGLERFLVEQAMRNLSLRLVHAFVTRRRHGRDYWAFAYATVSGLITEVSAVLRCCGIVMPNTHVERLPLIEQHLSVDVEVLTELLAERSKPRSHTEEATLSCHARLCAIADAAVSRMGVA